MLRSPVKRRKRIPVTEKASRDSRSLEKLLNIIRTLRSPTGCLWDRQQQPKDIGRYLIDEAYEVIDAIDSVSMAALREELGDLSFQILFLIVMAEEKEAFTLADVLNDVAQKMIRRHPHVFGDRKVRDIEEIRANWQDIKENLENKPRRNGLLDGIAHALPSLLKAQKMTEKVSQVGFDWREMDGVLAKVEEELQELRDALKSRRQDKIGEEMGDLLFSLVNLSRFAGVNAEEALRQANKKFAGRFAYIEERLAAQGKTPGQVTLAEMDRLWDEYKIANDKS
jgi:tetrapyrrole methylase family protein / MazG family protein